MTDIEKPDDKPRWASDDVISPITGVLNVVPPPESKRNVGYNTFEPPARNFDNWLQRYNYLWVEFLEDRVVNRQPVTDGNGLEIFNKDDVLITLYAIDTTTPANYIHAVGYRAASTNPVLNVISNNVLTLGTSSTTGTQQILGGLPEDIIIYGQMQKISNN